MKKQRVFYSALAVVLLALPYQSQAQSDFGRALNGPGIYLDTYFSPAKDVNDPQFESQQGKVGYQLYQLSVDFNLFHSNDPEKNTITHLTNEISFRYHHFNLEGALATELPETVYGLDYLVTGTHSFNSRWSMIAVASLGLFSDFEKVTIDDFLISGGLFAVYAINPRLHLGIGPELTYVFGEPLLIPAPYLNWYLGSKILLDIQAPSHAILHYNASEILHFKLAGRFNLGTQYNISLPNSAIDQNLLFSEGTLGLDTQIEITNHFSVEVDLAYALYRRLAVSSEGGFSPTVLPQKQFNYSSGFLPSINLSWNLQ